MRITRNMLWQHPDWGGEPPRCLYSGTERCVLELEDQGSYVNISSTLWYVYNLSKSSHDRFVGFVGRNVSNYMTIFFNYMTNHTQPTFSYWAKFHIFLKDLCNSHPYATKLATRNPNCSISHILHDTCCTRAQQFLSVRCMGVLFHWKPAPPWYHSWVSMAEVLLWQYGWGRFHGIDTVCWIVVSFVEIYHHVRKATKREGRKWRHYRTADWCGCIHK